MGRPGDTHRTSCRKRACATRLRRPLEFRAAVLGLAGFVEISQEQSAPAAALFQQAIALQDTESDLWYWLSWAQLDQGETDAAARSVARIFRRWPEAIDTIDDGVGLAGKLLV